MEHEAAGVRREPRLHDHGLAHGHHHRVLPRAVAGVHGTGRAVEHADVDAVQMHRMRPVRVVHPQPALGRPQPHARVDPVHVEPDPRDLPLRRAGGREHQVPAAGRDRRGDLLARPQLRRHAAGVGAATGHVEPQHGAGGAGAEPVGELDLGARAPEVDDHVDALGRRERHRAAAHGRLEQAAVTGDLDERIAVRQPQRVVACVRGVQEAETVERPLDREPRRHRAVDDDRVAHEALVDVLGVPQRPVLVERPVLDHQRHVEVAAREFERALEVVLDDVEPGQAVEHRLRRQSVGVVVVPERRGVLGVRVRVVERAAGSDQLHRVAVDGGRHESAVQVDVLVERQPVRHLHDRAALPGADRRAGVDAVVAVDRRQCAGDDLGPALADRELVEIFGAAAGNRHQRRRQLEVDLIRGDGGCRGRGCGAEDGRVPRRCR